MISIIFAHEKNNGFSNKGELPWGKTKTKDMLFFKTATLNNIVIMGWNTYLSLNRVPLPNRVNIVVTSRQAEPVRGVLFLDINTVDKIVDRWNFKKRRKNLYVIGGVNLIYRYIDKCDIACITRIDENFDHDIKIDVDIIKHYFPHPIASFSIYSESTFINVYSKTRNCTFYDL